MANSRSRSNRRSRSRSNRRSNRRSKSKRSNRRSKSKRSNRRSKSNRRSRSRSNRRSKRSNRRSRSRSTGRSGNQKKGGGISAAELLMRTRQNQPSGDQCELIVSQLKTCKQSDAFKIFASMEVDTEMGKTIVEYMDKKNKADRIFFMAQKQVEFHVEAKLITHKAGDMLERIVKESQVSYDMFVSDVINKNSYQPKNSARVILDTPKKWAECIIELVSLVEVDFKQAFTKGLEGYKKANENTYNAMRCARKRANECSLPCVVRGGPFSRVCSYMPPAQGFV